MPIFKKGGVTVANRIKGITVEIGGDTTGLDKALKGVNSTIKSTQSQLRDVNRLLKLDPSNAKLLAQKQQLLQKEISETSEKLNALKEADKQAKIQLENGELGQDKYDALQREIIETENNLKALEEEAKKVPSALSVSMKETGDKIKEVGDKTTEVGKGLSTHVTAPIVAIGAASLSAFNEVDKGMDIITQKTGASGKALKEMQDSMKNLATSIPTDFETAGAAIGEVNTRFGLTGQKLEELSGKFIKFAQLNNIDVSTAIDNTQKVISAFGLKAEDAGALSAEDITTAIIPLGKEIDGEENDILKKYTDIQSVNDGKNYLVSKEAKDEFGWVCRVIRWDDVTVPANLLRKGAKWLKDNQFEMVELALSAVDLSEFGIPTETIECGDRVRCIAYPFGMDRVFPVMKQTIPLQKPGEIKVVLGSNQAKGYIQSSQDAVRQLKEENLVTRKIDNERVQSAIDNLKAQMNISEGGYKLTEYDSSGRWLRDLYMDTPYKNTATKVLQVNMTLT